MRDVRFWVVLVAALLAWIGGGKAHAVTFAEAKAIQVAACASTTTCTYTYLNAGASRVYCARYNSNGGQGYMGYYGSDQHGNAAVCGSVYNNGSSTFFTGPAHECVAGSATHSGVVSGGHFTGGQYCKNGCIMEPSGTGVSVILNPDDGSDQSGLGEWSQSGQPCTSEEALEEDEEAVICDVTQDICYDPNTGVFCATTSDGLTCVPAPTEGLSPGGCVAGDTSAACRGSGAGSAPPPPPNPPIDPGANPGPTSTPVSSPPSVFYTDNSSSVVNITVHEQAPPGTPPDGTDEDGACTLADGCGPNGEFPQGSCTDPDGCVPPSEGGGQTSEGHEGPTVPPGTCMNPPCNTSEGPVPEGGCTLEGGCGGAQQGECTQAGGCPDGEGSTTSPGGCTNPLGCNDGTTPQGTCLRADGCPDQDGNGTTPPGGCTNAAGCGTDGVCDPATEECGDDGSASGGVGCEAPPACSGNPILCMAVFQSWKTRCAAEQISEAFEPGPETTAQQIVNGLGDEVTTAESEGVWADADAAAAEVHEISEEGFGWSRSCPNIEPVEIFGASIDIGALSKLCDIGLVVRALVLLLGMVVSLRIFGGSR